jgi:predicted RNase H-like nuclease (RuvC/YqgF family)
MRNIVIVVLSLALAAAIISGFIFYQKSIDTQDALLISENNLSGLHEKVTRLNQETASLQDQIKKNAERLKELEGAKKRISELEHAITVKDQAISECEETLLSLASWAGEKKYRMRGELTAIDLTYHTAVIEVPFSEKTFTIGGSISSGAILKRGGQSVGLADFQVGDRVVVIWESTRRGHVIHSLTAN